MQRKKKVFSSTTVQKPRFFSSQPSLWSNSHIHTWLLEKTIALTIWTFVSKVMSLLFNTLSRFVIAFLPRSKHPLILWLQSPSAVILEPKKTKSATVSTFSPSICHEEMGLDDMILVLFFFSAEFQASFFTLFLHIHQEVLYSSSLSAIIMVSSAYLRLLIFFLAILIPACDLAFRMMNSA